MNLSEPKGPRPALVPLLADDPPKVGDFWLDARLAASASGIAYVAHDDGDQRVMLVLLSEGAAEDAAARERFAGAINRRHIDTVIARGGQGQQAGRLAHKFRPEADDPMLGSMPPAAPWAALVYDGSPEALGEARSLLTDVDLSLLGAQGQPSGPAYEHYWIEQAQPGRWRLWPLPWPGRGDRAGWLSILASWLLMLLMMLLAVLIAILLFQNSSQQQPPPPVPTSASASGSPTSASGSPSPSPSGSPSSASASPSPSQGNSPSPNSRL